MWRVVDHTRLARYANDSLARWRTEMSAIRYRGGRALAVFVNPLAGEP